MNPTTTSASSKSAKWRRRLLGLAAVIGLISMAALINLWIETRDWTNVVSYSKNAQHFEIRVGGGYFIGFHISNWWTDTEFQFDGDTKAPNLNPRQWIGFDVQSETHFTPFHFASGEYHHGLIDMTNVVFAPHYQQGKSLRFKVCWFPIWIPCVACALPSLWWLVRRRLHRASPEPSAGVEPSPRPISSS